MTSNMPMQQTNVATLIKQQTPAIAKAIGGATDEEQQARAERFARIALTTIRGNDQLMRCRPESMCAALMACAQFDMEPDARGLVWLVPYKGQVQFQLGYKGMIELAIRSGKVKDIYAEVVYEEEYKAGMFSYTGGTKREIHHRYDLLRPKLRQGGIIAAYAVATMDNDVKHVEVVDREYIEKRRNASQSKNSKYSPWNCWFEEMVKKTAVKALCRTLPQSVERLQMAIAEENKFEARIIRDREQSQNEVDELNATLGLDAAPEVVDLETGEVTTTEKEEAKNGEA